MALFGIHDLGLFIVSGLLLNLMPGPDSLLIMSRSASQGARAGLAATAGIGTGVFVHIFAAALGLVGRAANLGDGFYGRQIHRRRLHLVYGDWPAAGPRRDGAAQLNQAPPMALRTIFGQGFLTNVLNPKVALFFLAFVPQFIDAHAPSKALTFIILGCIFNLNGMLWCCGLALFTARASASVRLSARTATLLSRVTGGLFIWLGIKLALSKNS